MSLHTLAQHLQSAGRGEDKVLVHMTPKEVSGLQSLAMAHGGSLSINPKTGLPEAGFLSSILPIVAGAALGPAGIGLSAMQAAAVTGIAGAAMTGSLGKGLMMGLGAYGGAGLGAGLSAAGAVPAEAAALSAIPQATAAPAAAASTPLAGAIQTAQAANAAAPAMSLAPGATGAGVALGATPGIVNQAGAITPATTEATGQSIFDKFQQVGRGLGNVFGGGQEGDQAREKFTSKFGKPEMYSMGLSALMAARQEQQDALERQMREANRPVGPWKPKYEYDAGYNPAATSATMTGERQYFNPQYTPIRYAADGGVMASPQMGGGPVEQMSTLNAIGANTRYPMANLTNAKYATAAQRPISENVLTPMTNYNVDPYSGEQRFAGGGLAALARYADGGKTMTLAQATQQAKSEGVKSIGAIGGAQGLANRYGATLTVGSKTYTPSASSTATSGGTKTGTTGTTGTSATGTTGAGTTGASGATKTLPANLANNPMIQAVTSAQKSGLGLGMYGPMGGPSQAAINQQQADTTRKPVTVGGVTYQPKVTNEIDVPDLSSKQLGQYNNQGSLEDLIQRYTGLDRLTVAQKSQVRDLIKNKNVTNVSIENLVNDFMPKRDEDAYLGLPTLPTDIGGKGKQPIFGEPPKGQTAVSGYDYINGKYVPKSEDSNIYLSPKVRDITKVSDLDPVTIALYGRKATLSDLANYDTKKLGQKLSLADVYYDMSQSQGYQDFLSGQELAYINKFSAKPSDISSIYRDLFNKAAPQDIIDYYEAQAMTPEQVRQALLNSPEYEAFLNQGIKPDLTVDQTTGQVTIPGAIQRPVGPAVTAAGDIAYKPTYGGGASTLPPITRATTDITPAVTSAFTPNYAQSPIQNALAPAFTPSSVFTLPSVSMQNAPAQPLVSTGALPSPTNMFAPSSPAISPFSPYGTLTPEQISKLTPQELQQYLSSMQTPVGSNIFSAGTYKPFAEGGMASGGYNLGAYSDGGRLLKGPGDGVSDSIPASIGDRQPARLADGEFVIPARIVSEIGNGSTDAGARRLYAMMDKIQKVRNKTVGKGKVAVDTKAEKYLPA